MPLVSSTDATTLAIMEQQLLEILLASEKPLCVISLGSDGSILEHDTHRALVRSGFAEHITHPIPRLEGLQFEGIHIQVLCVCGQHIATIQDPKHCRKTACNNLFSAAWLLVLGNHAVYYEQIRNLASKADTPLYWRDVNRLNRQDDCAAACLFSVSFLHYTISQQGNDNPALPIYLFVIGELVDAYENRYIPHIECVRMVLHM